MQASAEPGFKDYITAISVLVSVAGLLYTWTKDRLFRRQEYADRIRTAAATTMAKLERWQEIALQYFEALEPATLDAALRVEAGEDPHPVARALWRETVSARAAWAQRVMDEEIELAYVHLYAHDFKIQERFADVLRRLDEHGETIYRRCLIQTQNQVLAYRGAGDASVRSRLAPELRLILVKAGAELEAASAGILAEFREEVERIVQMDDRQLMQRGFRRSSRLSGMRARMQRLLKAASKARPPRPQRQLGR